MSDEKYYHNNKEEVAHLIRVWIDRTGYKRQNLANLANFYDYNQFYKAYLDMRRCLNKNPDMVLGVVRAVMTNLPPERRATLKEILIFLTATEFPASRLKEFRHLFTPQEWAEIQAELFI